MESVVRYDFSFPPKSSSLNNNNNNNNNNNSNSSLNQNNTPVTTGNHSHIHHHNQTHTIHNRQGCGSNNAVHHVNSYNYQRPPQSNNNGSIGLSKSASTSLLSCTSNSTIKNNNNNNSNNNNNVLKMNNNYCYNCNNCGNSTNAVCNTNNLNVNKNIVNGHGKSSSSQNNYHNQHNFHHNLIKTSPYGLLQQTIQHGGTNMPVPMMTPATPKDSNCSFTFDDLKNTLAFMEDSPLINTNHNNNNNANTNSNNSNKCATNSNALMVIPNASTVDCTSSSSSSSSSSLSSSGSSSSSCSSNSCCGTALSNFMPKSNSNPMLSSSVTSSSLSTASSGAHSPTSCHLTMSHPINKSSECVCSASQKQQQSSVGLASSTNGSTSQKSVLDLFIKKSPSNIENLHHYDLTPAVSSSNSTNGNLLTNVQIPPTSTSNGSIHTAIETAAKKYRCAAQVSEATCCWKGKLPPKQYKTPIVYSTKVFVGGLPWDITEDDIIKEFGVFGPCRVEWTNKEKFNLLSGIQVQATQELVHNAYDNNNNNQAIQYNGNSQQQQQQFKQNRSMSNLNPNSGKMNGNNNNNNNNNNCNQQTMIGGGGDPLSSSKHRLSPGFAYVIYDSEYSVRSLVGNCIEDYQNGRDRVEYYFKISTRRVRNKEVQIIPWILADNNFALCTPKELDPKKTVFVGNLHGTMTARDLAHIVNELFGCVVYAGIDIDKLKYPIGSGRVTFSHQQNFMRAVRAAFVDIQSSKFSKRIQIDPYLEDVQCCACYGEKGIYFCRDFQCFNYYCGVCWDKQHSYKQLGNHKPLMRKREDKF